MNETVNKFLLVGDKFMPKQPGFTCSACGPFTKKKELKSLFRLEIQILLTKTNLIKLDFEHDMAYGKSKDLAKRTQSDKVLKIKHLKLPLIQIMVIKED